MKFQFSLRTLTIACLAAGLAVGICIRFYLEKVEEPELKARFDEIRVATRASVCVKNYRYFSNKSIVGEPRWPSISAHADEWEIKLSNWITIYGQERGMYGVLVSCERRGFGIEPICFEYDNSIENEELIQRLKAICDKKHWQYVVRKVERIEE